MTPRTSAFRQLMIAVALLCVLILLLSVASAAQAQRLTSNFCTPQRATEVRTLLAAHPPAGLSSRVEQTIDTIEQCAALVKGQQPAFTAAREGGR